MKPGVTTYLCGPMPALEETLAPLRSRRLDWAALLARVWDITIDYT